MFNAHIPLLNPKPISFSDFYMLTDYSFDYVWGQDDIQRSYLDNMSFAFQGAPVSLSKKQLSVYYIINLNTLIYYSEELFVTVPGTNVPTLLKHQNEPINIGCMPQTLLFYHLTQIEELLPPQINKSALETQSSTTISYNVRRKVWNYLLYAGINPIKLESYFTVVEKKIKMLIERDIRSIDETDVIMKQFLSFKLGMSLRLRARRYLTTYSIYYFLNLKHLHVVMDDYVSHFPEWFITDPYVYVKT